MDEIIENLIRVKANDIRHRVEGGKLYGEYVNIYDTDFLLVAAYYLGMSDAYPTVTLQSKLE